MPDMAALMDDQIEGAQIAFETLAHDLASIEPSQMNANELDLAAAQLLELPLRMTPHGIEACVEGVWRKFSPTTSWDDHGYLVTRVELVTGTHRTWDDSGNPNGFYFSCHAFFGGTKTAGKDLRTVVSQTAALLWRHQLKLPRKN